MSTAPDAPVVSPGVLLFLFDFDHRATGLNLQGVTHEESLVAAAPGGNPMNWVLGHILANRSFVLTLLGGQAIWSEDDGYCYAEKGAWTDPATQARPWNSLLADFETTQERIREGLARVTPEFLADKHAPDARRPRGMQLHFMQFHEAYHVGQLGLLRRVIGKPGAI
jgi:hypothetical protein